MATSLPVFFFLLVLTVFTLDAADSSFVVDVDEYGKHYAIKVKDKTWLPSGDTWFNANRRRYSIADNNLKFQDKSVKKGVDFYGEFSVRSFEYVANVPYKVVFETSIKTYIDRPNVAIFSQKRDKNLFYTKGKSKDDIVAAYPGFLLPSEVFDEPEVDLGYVAYGNDMAGWVSLNIGRWTSERANFSSGIRGGPIILFDGSTDAVVISPLSHFTAMSHVKTPRGAHANISWGVMGGVDQMPLDCQSDVIVYYSNQGINKAVSGWGDYLTGLYGKSSRKRDNDLTLTHLGYWTDNGAYYYYNTEDGKNYEETMLDVVEYLRKIKLPVKYLQIDSWFYEKGHVQGTKSWTPMKSVFPNGFDYLYEQTKLPIGCHNRYWDSDTIYAYQNGGKYPFIFDRKTGYAAVTNHYFWNDLFKNSTENWGKLILYEQDWFDGETDNNEKLVTDLEAAELWLHNMGASADLYNVTIQYCMEYSRHVLESVKIGAVTQARASDDYQPGNEQWRIGVTSMFLDALNLAPSKDTFWTTSDQPGNKYNLKEKSPFTQALMATLSKGPVGPGDRIGYVDKNLLMKCCDNDGKILKPTRPATAIDESMKRLAFEDVYTKQSKRIVHNPNDEYVYTTYADINNYYFLTMVAGFIKKPYQLTLDMGWPTLPIGHLDYVIYDAAGGSPDYQKFSNSEPFTLGSACQNRHCFFQASPILWREDTGGIVLLGEMDKFVPLSPQRFHNLHYTNANNIRLTVNVNAGEVVHFSYLKWGESQPRTVSCDNSKGVKRMPESYIFLSDQGYLAKCVITASIVTF